MKSVKMLGLFKAMVILDIVTSECLLFKNEILLLKHKSNHTLTFDIVIRKHKNSNCYAKHRIWVFKEFVKCEFLIMEDNYLN